MDSDEARRRLTAARVGRLATVRPNGAPHLIPVVFAVVRDVLYSVVDGKPKTTRSLQRLANIEATGRASVLVDSYSEDWSRLWWVRVDGPAEVLDKHAEPLPETGVGAERRDQVRLALEALTDKYPQYVSQPPPGPVWALHLTRWHWWEATPVP